MKLRKIFTGAVCSTMLILGGPVAAFGAVDLEQVPFSATNEGSYSKTINHNGHTYTVKFDASAKQFMSYRDGWLVNRIDYDDLKSQIEQAEKIALEDRANKCSVGMTVVTIINSALWLGAGIATGGVAVPVAGFVTSLIPTFGSLVC